MSDNDKRILSDEQAHVLRLRAEGSTEGWRILAVALLVDRAARREHEAADLALLRRAEAYMVHDDDNFGAYGGCSCGLDDAIASLRARIGGG